MRMLNAGVFIKAMEKIKMSWIKVYVHANFLFIQAFSSFLHPSLALTYSGFYCQTESRDTSAKMRLLGCLVLSYIKNYTIKTKIFL